MSKSIKIKILKMVKGNILIFFVWRKLEIA